MRGTEGSTKLTLFQTFQKLFKDHKRMETKDSLFRS